MRPRLISSLLPTGSRSATQLDLNSKHARTAFQSRGTCHTENGALPLVDTWVMCSFSPQDVAGPH